MGMELSTMKKLTKHRSKLIIGPPGTGKTTTLIDEVQKQVDDGVDPFRIAYVAHTKKAAAEAASRTKLSAENNETNNFRTIHSLAYRALELGPGDVMGPDDYQELGVALNMTFSRYFNPDEAMLGGQTEGDRIRAVAEYAGATCQDVDDVMHERADDIDSWRLRLYMETLKQYKIDTKKLDFNDMLVQVQSQTSPLELQYAVIDEAQDLSQLQWRAVRHMFSKVKHLLMAGDDDQAIFRWAGADITEFLSLQFNRTVLDQSYRVPRSIFQIAERISARIQNRYDKVWRPKVGEEGTIETVGTPDDVDLTQEGTYYLLGRNTYLLQQWEDICRDAGVPYQIRNLKAVKKKHIRAIRAWERMRKGEEPTVKDKELAVNFATPLALQTLERRRHDTPVWFEALLGIPGDDANYYRQLLIRGHNLDIEPRFIINTVHGVKGGEADHVMLLTDRSALTDQMAEKSEEDEHRVMYVAVTRAKQSLTIVAPQGLTYYRM